MTIFVDNAFIQATVGNNKSQWCHLVSDQYDSADLHPFAQRIGLRREWFQYKSDIPGQECAPPWRWHYDVTLRVRAKAVEAGAREIDLHTFARLIDLKRKIFGQLPEDEKTAERARWEAIALGREKWEQAGLF